MNKYFIMTLGLASGIALGAGVAIAETAGVKVDTEAGVTVDGTKVGVAGDASVGATTDMTKPGLAGDVAANTALASSDLIGLAVYDETQTRIGEISEIFADPVSGDSHVVVDVGGFLGMGEHRVALAMADLNITVNTDGNVETVTVLKTKTELEAMPAVVS